MADSVGLDYGDALLINLMYEFEATGCTSIVAQDAAGGFLHARNLDFAGEVQSFAVL